MTVIRQNFGVLSLRLGIGCIFILFGFDKFVHSAHWLVFIPNEIKNFIERIPAFNAYHFLRIQGTIEIILGLHLAAGFCTRWAAAAAACLLAAIIYALQWDPIAIRDFGLFASSAALVFFGGGDWSVDAWMKK